MILKVKKDRQSKTFQIIETILTTPGDLLQLFDSRTDWRIEDPYLNQYNEVCKAFIFFPGTYEFWLDTKKWSEYKRSNEYHKFLSDYPNRLSVSNNEIGKNILKWIDEFCKDILRDQSIDNILK